MRKIFITFALILASALAMGQTLRVMSYNVRHCEGMDNVLDTERTAQAIERWKPDVVALQELDSCARRTKGVDQTTLLGHSTLMYPVFGQAIPLQGGGYGVGMLSKERPKCIRRILMPSRSEDRMLLVCEFKDYVVACTHLSLNEDEHMASFDTIVKEAARYQKPFIIMGDWNTHPDSPFIEKMKQHFTFISSFDKATWPADKPTDCIDYIAVYNQPGKAKMAAKASYRVVDDSLTSDHRPLVADIALKTPAHKLMTTKPYLQDPRPDRMTVMFQTNAVCHAWIEYGTDSTSTQRARSMLDGQEVCYDIENRITLNNLQPSERYFYRVCLVGLTHKRSYETHFGDTLKTKFFSFRTPKDDATDFTALVFNDLHQVKAVYDTLLCQLRGIDYDFVVFNGDCLPEPADRNDAIRMIHNIADPINGAEKPIIFMRGNHEIRNFYSAGMHSLIGYRDNKTYGAFNWGDTRFILLDLGEDKPDDTKVYAGLNDFEQLRQDQFAFLQKELKSREFKKARRRILINHIPIFGNDDKYRPCTELWGELLKGQPFDLNFCAHVHQLKFFKNGTENATFPILRGGAPNIEGCAVSILSKKGPRLNLRVLTANGEAINEDL